VRTQSRKLVSAGASKVPTVPEDPVHLNFRAILYDGAQTFGASEELGHPPACLEDLAPRERLRRGTISKPISVQKSQRIPRWRGHAKSTRSSRSAMSSRGSLRSHAGQPLLPSLIVPGWGGKSGTSRRHGGRRQHADASSRKWGRHVRRRRPSPRCQEHSSGVLRPVTLTEMGRQMCWLGALRLPRVPALS